MKATVTVFLFAALLNGCATVSDAACNAGETRACVGPGGCEGGQQCAADGSWETCDCGGDGAQTSNDETEAVVTDSVSDGAPEPADEAEGDPAAAPGEASCEEKLQTSREALLNERQCSADTDCVELSMNLADAVASTGAADCERAAVNADTDQTLLTEVLSALGPACGRSPCAGSVVFCAPLADGSTTPLGVAPACNPDGLCIMDDWCPCENGDRLPRVRLCGGLETCADANDETICVEPATECPEFACDNGSCVPQSWICDGADDCSDGSDEVGCGCADGEVLTAEGCTGCEIVETQTAAEMATLREAFDACETDTDCTTSFVNGCSGATCVAVSAKDAAAYEVAAGAIYDRSCLQFGNSCPPPAMGGCIAQPSCVDGHCLAVLGGNPPSTEPPTPPQSTPPQLTPPMPPSVEPPSVTPPPTTPPGMLPPVAEPPTTEPPQADAGP